MNRSQTLIPGDLTLAYGLSLVAGLLVAGVSLAGLLFQRSMYLTDELYKTFVANDIVTLFIGLPILLASMWLTRRGKLIGLLFWPGALLYVLYNYIAYVIGIPFGGVTFVYLALVLLSAYVIFDLLHSIDKKFVRERLSGVVPVKISGWTMVLLGSLFIMRTIGVIAPTITNQTTLPASEIGVLVADLVLSALLITGGALLLRRMPLGYASGLGLLFAANMLFIALIIFLLLQPVLTGAPFVLVDVIVVCAMTVICFIPFILFARGVVSK